MAGSLRLVDWQMTRGRLHASTRVLRRQARAALKPVTVSVLGSRPVLLSRLRRLARTMRPTVLSLHRVHDHAGAAPDVMNPRLFEELLVWLIGSFSLTTFGRLSEMRAGGKPPLILSFDDGYRDFVEVVAPILDTHDVRANQNVIPRCVESRRPPHTVVVREFIRSAPSALLREVNVVGLPRIDASHRDESAQEAASTLKRLTIRNQDDVMDRLQHYVDRLDNFAVTPMMTRAEIAEMSQIHEVGAHSFEHATMTSETDEYAREDVQRCRHYFRNHFGYYPTVYAFPNGVARPTQANGVHEAGFAHVLLTGSRFSDAPAWMYSRGLVYGDRLAEVRFRVLAASISGR